MIIDLTRRAIGHLLSTQEQTNTPAILTAPTTAPTPEEPYATVQLIDSFHIQQDVQDFSENANSVEYVFSERFVYKVSVYGNGASFAISLLSKFLRLPNTMEYVRYSYDGVIVDITNKTDSQRKLENRWLEFSSIDIIVDKNSKYVDTDTGLITSFELTQNR